MPVDLGKLLSKAEELGWSYGAGGEPEGMEGGWYHEEKHWVELRKKSPAGEDFRMKIVFEKEHPKETFLVNLSRFWHNFSPEEHAEMWIPQRGKGGCPESILDLLADAEQIKDSVFDLWLSLAEKPLFGVWNARFSVLLREVEELLSAAPREEDCCEGEREVFSDLARVRDSLIRAGIQEK